MQDRKEENETSGLLPGVRPSPIEYQYFLAEYPVLNGTLAVSYYHCGTLVLVDLLKTIFLLIYYPDFFVSIWL